MAQKQHHRNKWRRNPAAAGKSAAKQTISEAAVAKK